MNKLNEVTRMQQLAEIRVNDPSADKINNLQELIEFSRQFDGVEDTFNVALIQKLKKNQIKEELYLTYLQITQNEVFESLEDNSEDYNEDNEDE
jgi:uncharacterized protein (DUF4213/DUF364 family)